VSLIISRGFGSCSPAGGSFSPILKFDVYFDFQTPQGLLVENLDYVSSPSGLRVENTATIVSTPRSVLVEGVVVVQVPSGLAVEDLDYVSTPAGLAVEEL
jgi:hypothetical protein